MQLEMPVVSLKTCIASLLWKTSTPYLYGVAIRVGFDMSVWCFHKQNDRKACNTSSEILTCLGLGFLLQACFADVLFELLGYFLCDADALGMVPVGDSAMQVHRCEVRVMSAHLLKLRVGVPRVIGGLPTIHYNVRMRS